jgi:hypothetical protein
MRASVQSLSVGLLQDYVMYIKLIDKGFVGHCIVGFMLNEIGESENLSLITGIV